MGGMTAAHKSLPFGTKLRVTNKNTGKSVVVRINDRGPFIKGRQLDLSKGAATRIGLIRTAPGGERRYLRRLDADEMQYQASGHRTLITQHGVVDLGPGDFVRIPVGIAHASVTTEVGDYICLLSRAGLPQVADTSRVADRYSPERLTALNVEVRS
jgi:hypothetical protein